MLIYFDEKNNRVAYDQYSLERVPEFVELVSRFGKEAFDVVALLEDALTFYRHIEYGKLREEAVIKDWKKLKNVRLILTQDKINNPIFEKAREKYEELSYSPLKDEYVTLEAGLKEDLRVYREQYANQPQKVIKKKDGDDIPVNIQHDPKDRATLRKNIEDAQNRLDEIRPRLFEKSTHLSSQKRTLRTIKEGK